MSGETVLWGEDLVPADEVRLSPWDRGFLFADAVYEVVPVYGGEPFLLDAHLARLERSLSALAIPAPWSREHARGLLGKLLRANEARDALLYLQVTRGVSRPRDHRLPEPAPEPSVFATVSPHPPPDAARAREGVRASLVRDERWGRCDIKSTALLANVLAREEARRRGAEEALLVRDGLLTEGSSSNVFLVRRGEVVTPADGPHVLAGVTRDFLAARLEAAGIAVRRRAVPVGWIAECEELWITSSGRGVVRVADLDGRALPLPKEGGLFARAWELFEEGRRTAGDARP